MALRLIGKPSPLLPSLPSPLLHTHLHPHPLPLPLITASLPQQVLLAFFLLGILKRKSGLQQTHVLFSSLTKEEEE